MTRNEATSPDTDAVLAEPVLFIRWCIGCGATLDTSPTCTAACEPDGACTYCGCQVGRWIAVESPGDSPRSGGLR